jgi:hypothetical protein
VVSFPQVSPPKSCILLSSPPYALHAPPISFSNNIGWAVQIIKVLIMQFSSLPCYLVPLRSKYSPQHPILRHPQPTSSLPTRNKFLPIFFGSLSWFCSSATIVTQPRVVGLLDLTEGVRFFLSHSLTGRGRAETEYKLDRPFDQFIIGGIRPKSATLRSHLLSVSADGYKPCF